MPNTKRFNLGGTALPVDIDALEGLPTDGGVIQFDFGWRGYRFAARAEDLGDGSGSMKVAADVGRMPFSAEAPAARSGLSAVIMHANGLVGRVFRLDGERILLGSTLPVEAPMTATRLLAPLAKFLIPLNPYLDLISVYYEPGGEVLKREWRRPSRLPPQAAKLLTR